MLVKVFFTFYNGKIYNNVDIFNSITQKKTILDKVIYINNQFDKINRNWPYPK